MKKLYALVLCAVLALSLAGCGDKAASSGGTLDLSNLPAQLEALTFTDTDNTQAPLFSSMTDMDASVLTEVWGVDSALFESILVRVPMMNVRASMYVLAKPVQGKEEDAKAALDAYMQKYDDQWAQYLPDQYDLVRGRSYAQVGDWLVYIISADNDAVLKQIQSAVN